MKSSSGISVSVRKCESWVRLPEALLAACKSTFTVLYFQAASLFLQESERVNQLARMLFINH